MKRGYRIRMLCRLLLPILAVAILSGCNFREQPKQNIESESLARNRSEAIPSDSMDPHSARLAGLLGEFNSGFYSIIHDPNLNFAQKHLAVQNQGRLLGPELLAKIDCIRERIESDDSLYARDRFRATLGVELARYYLDAFLARLDYEIPDVKPTARSAPPLILTPANEVLDRYWMFYHYTEILGVYNDESGYSDVWAPSGRTSFIEQEVGRYGIEMQMDWWYLPLAIWEDPTPTPEQKLMSTKFTMWQSPDWGGGNHYINEYWSWEPGYKDEDCPLFTGNLMSALAAEYSMTRKPRTLSRLRHMVDAFLFFDELAADEANTAIGGRVQRGPKTYNLYPEDEPNLLTVTWDGQQLEFHHNNSVADHDTGRERKNVSRDQYYGVITGYYTIYHLFSQMDSLSQQEQELLSDVIDHTHHIVRYLTVPRYREDYGALYNLYAFFEGSCANPPNLSFMGYAAFVGLEEITGRQIPSNDMGYTLFHALLELGVLIGSVDLSAALFEPAHTGLTAMNQYLGALFMSDLPREHWEFIFPPEIIRDGDEGQRKLWRRLIAAYALKFGDLGNADYEAVIQEMLNPANNPQVTIDTVFNSIRQGHAVIEPGGVGIEDMMWPTAFMFAAAQNASEIGGLLNGRYDALIGGGTMVFEHTDVLP